MDKLIVANYKMNGNADFYKKVSQKVNSLKLKDAKDVISKIDLTDSVTVVLVPFKQ